MSNDLAIPTAVVIPDERAEQRGCLADVSTNFPGVQTTPELVASDRPSWMLDGAALAARPRSAAAGNVPVSASRTLVFCIPLFYNPGDDGIKIAVEPEKIFQTKREIPEICGGCGYSWWLIWGWYRNPLTGEEFVDRLFRFEIDGQFDANQWDLLRSWKRQLEERFRQQAIYFRLSGTPECL
jgi:hypothetical protein